MPNEYIDKCPQCEVLYADSSGFDVCQEGCIVPSEIFNIIQKNAHLKGEIIKPKLMVTWRANRRFRCQEHQIRFCNHIKCNLDGRRYQRN